jgi:hypothetical protein
VHDHARRIEHATQAGRALREQFRGEPLAEVAGIGARANLFPRPLEHRPRGIDRERVVHPAGKLVDGWQVAQLHDP